MFSIPSIWSIRQDEKTELLPPSSPLFLSACCALLSWVWLPPVLADCVNTSLQQTGSPGPSIEIGPGILGGILADDDHLRVVVQAPEAISGTLSLIDSEGLIAAEEAVSLEAYELGEIWMLQALQEVPDRGFQFTLRLEDFASGVPTLLTEMPLHIGLSCPSVNVCSLVAKPGFSTPGALVEEQLIAALEEAETTGSDDMLGFVLELYPELAGSVYELALTSDASSPDPTLSGARPDPDPCTCRWIPSVDIAAPSIPEVSSNQKELVTEWKRGVAGYAAAQTVDGVLSANFSGAFSSLGMHLVCSLHEGFRPTESVQINDRPVQSFEIPTLLPCESDCEGSIQHSARSELCTEAKVYGGGGRSAEADLRLDSQFSIDGNVQFAISAWTDLYVESTSTDQQLTQTTKAKTVSVPSKSSVGRITLDGSFMAGAQRNSIGDSGSYTFAAASSGFTQWVTGGDTCAPQTTVYFAVDDSGGGEVLVRWGDPP